MRRVDESSALDWIGRAAELHTKAVVAMDRGHPLEAERLLGRALKALATDLPESSIERRNDVRARVLITMANVDFELRGLTSAMNRLDAAAELVRMADLLSLNVSLHNQRGRFLLKAGRPAEALVEFDLATTHFAHAATIERCRVLLNRGAVHLDHGAVALARRDLSRCVHIAAASADTAGGQSGLELLHLKALHNLGYVEFLGGDLPRALALMDEAFRMDPTVSPGIALIDRARVLLEAGLHREADETLAEAASIFSSDKLAQDLAETDLERARGALLSGDIVLARLLAARARDRFRRRGNDRWRRAAELVLLQGDLAAGRPGLRLVDPALRLRAEFAADGLAVSSRIAAAIAVEAHLSAGQVDQAAVLGASLGAVRRSDPITARLHMTYARAQLELARGRPATAARRARSGLTELATYQARFGSIDLQTAAAVHGRRLAELDIALALRSRRAEASFAAAEHARAVSSRLPVVRPPKDAITAELLAELRQVIESLRGVAQDATASAPLVKRRREIERQIQNRRWTLSGSGNATAVAGLAETREALTRQDAAMIYFVDIGGDVHAVVVDDHVRLHTLGPSNLMTEQVRRIKADLDVVAQPMLPVPLRAGVMASLRRSLDDLDRTALIPLASQRSRVVIVSTGVLGQVPWGLLPSLRARPVVVAPSATAWLAATRRRASGRRRRVALSGPGLLRSTHEAAAVAAIWANAGGVDVSATRPELHRAMAGASVVHLAAHGTHQTENPLFSSLRLADGMFFAHELDESARTPDHVVLSACELGLATVRPGDEALGLTSVLLRLGSRSVVAGVARVGDDVAADTMIDYHRRLATGQDSAAALAEAVDACDGVAPFVCFGASFTGPGK